MIYCEGLVCSCARFIKSKNVVDGFSFPGNEVDHHPRRQVLAFDGRDASTKARCAFRNRDRETGDVFPVFNRNAISEDIRAGRSDGACPGPNRDGLKVPTAGRRLRCPMRVR